MKRTLLLVSLAALLLMGWAAAQPSADPLMEGFRMVEVASVADATEQLYGERSYLAHDMRPVFKTIQVTSSWPTRMALPSCSAPAPLKFSRKPRRSTTPSTRCCPSSKSSGQSERPWLSSGGSDVELSKGPRRS